MAPDERHRFVGEHVSEISAVAGADRAVAVEVPVPIVLPAAAEADELIEPAPIRVVAIIEGPVVPLSDEPGDVAGGLHHVAERAFPERDAIEAPVLERVDRAGALRVAAGQQRGAGGRADGRGRVVLREAGAVGDQVVQRRCLGCAAVEAPEVAIAHVVGEDQDDVRPGHGLSSPAR